DRGRGVRGAPGGGHRARPRRGGDARGDRSRPNAATARRHRGGVMLEGLLHLFAARPLRQIIIDLLDIGIVTYVVYRALLVLRGTRAMQMGTGLGVIFLVYVVAKWSGFITLYNLLSTLLSSIILIVVVVFQNDIRRGLMRVGARAFFGGISR